MRIDLALPGHPFDAGNSVCIVVDVLRASSTIVTLLERGCERVVAAADVAEARRLHARLPDHLLCGEAGGLPPAGFDYGNSPAEFSRLDLGGRSAILATTNGTRALAEVAHDAKAVLVGCLLNRTAVANAALRLADEPGADITIVCAGDEGSPGEDLAGAHAIVAAACMLRPILDVPYEAIGGSTDFTHAVRRSRHADTLQSIGLGEDVEYCVRLDVSDVVPVLRRDARLLILEQFDR
jgi:2-phosphosulfolactate phosphatase